MRKFLSFFNLRTISFLLAVALAMPLPWQRLTGFYNWFSPFIMLNSVLVLKSFVWLNIVSLGVVLIVVFRKRWFCNNLCPLGWSCDRVSAISKNNASVHRRLPDLSRWLSIISIAAAVVGLPLFIIIDPMAIFNGFFTILTGKLSVVAVISLAGFPLLLMIHLILPGIWCTKLCPLGGLQLIIADIKTLLVRLFKREKYEVSVADPGRRYFVMAGIGLFAGAIIPKIMKPSTSGYIRPPAAVSPELFNSLCCRCGNCTKVCPTGIILPQTDLANITGWMTPEISFRSGYCLETCNLCSRVCPSGAITMFNVNAKDQLFMGTAEVTMENCLLVNNKECVKCRESCKFDAIEFVRGDSIFNLLPLVYINKCVGCGACEVVCPVNCIEVKPFVTSLLTV
jgi:ferredoxin